MPADLLGVYLRTFSTCFLTSPAGSTDFFPAAFAPFFDAAFFLPLAPPLTLGALAEALSPVSLILFNASFPFS